MQILIWAIGSMLVLMLILSFLPLGYTFKGKVLIAFVGFVISLGGLAAAWNFPLWQTILMLVSIIFFTAYIMDSRTRSYLYKERFSDIDNLNVRKTGLKDHFEQVIDDIPTNLGEVETSPLINRDSDIKSIRSLIPDYIKVVQEKDNNDEDISFLLEHNIDSDIKGENRNIVSEIDYLHEIETLLVKDIDEKMDDLAEELAGKIDIISGFKEEPIETSSDTDIIDDSIFEFLFSKNEVDSGRDLDEKGKNKIVETNP
jgi:hypothetical protein